MTRMTSVDSPSVLDAILYRKMKRIAEYLDGFLKAQAMLSLIGAVLRFVPFKTDAGHDNIISMIL